MQAKERVYESLKESCSNNGKITAAELAQKLNLSRQVISHYLTRLMEDGLAVKTSTRPVYWFPVTSEDLEFLEKNSGNARKPGCPGKRWNRLPFPLVPYSHPWWDTQGVRDRLWRCVWLQ